MSQAYLPNIRRRLLTDPDSPYAPMGDESIVDAPPAGMGTGPYSPPASAPRAADAPTLNAGAYAPPSTTAPPQPANAAVNPYLPQQNAAFHKLESAYSAPHAGTLRQVLGAFVGNRNPQLGGIISGETNRNRGIENAERDYQLIANAIATNRAMQTADVTNRKNTAEAGKLEAETSAIPAKTALEQAQAEAANYKEDPNLGLIDLRTKRPVSETGLAPLTKEEAEVLGKQEGDRVPLKVKNTANEYVMRGYTTVNTEEGVFERKRGAGAADMTRLGSNPRMMFAPGEQYTPVAADPNNPGNITLMKKGQAAKQGVSLPASAETQTAKATARAVAPGGKVGEEVNAFSTAIQHADLLRNAVSALGNGDKQTLNGLKNQLKNEFGMAGPVTAQAIADAYQREITSMLSKGHITDAEIGSVGKTLNVGRQSPEQTLGVIDAYKALAQSKMNVRKQGVEKGMKGKANFPESGPKVGDTVSIKGKQVKITAIHPDGSFDAE